MVFLKNVCCCKMFYIFLLLIVGSGFAEASTTMLDSSKVLTRKRRYIGFPEGSSISCAGCITVGTLGDPTPSIFPAIFTFGLNWSISYELPNATETALFYQKRYKKPIAQRRSRRELYEKVEAILDKLGYSGRQCILKTLCETTQRITPNSDNIVEEIFRTLFTLPLAKVLPSEPLIHSVYDSAYRLGAMFNSCEHYRCPLSLVDWALGYYNSPSPDLRLFENPWTIFRSTYE